VLKTINFHLKEMQMNQCIKVLMLIAAMPIFVGTAEARKDVSDFSIKDAMTHPQWESKIRSDIHLYFGSKNKPAVTRTFGEYRTSKKTNSFNKSDKEACEWAFMSAIIQLQQKAAKLGANAVINIKSNYDNIETSSSSTFKCAAGNVITGVALKGTPAILK